MNFITKLLCCYFTFSCFTLVLSKVGIKVKVTTWNVNEKPPIEDITKLVQLADGPDFYTFTLQEVNPKANPLSKNDEKWFNALNATMIWKGYKDVAWKSIDGSLTAVFTKAALRQRIANVDTSSLRTGKAGIIGNKGATAVRFDYEGNSIVFVGSHFHAHDDQVAARIEDFNKINKEVSFKTSKAKYIYDHDIVLWSGDLNFRIDDFTETQISEIVASKTPETVFAAFADKDQLRKAMKAGKIFQGYTEEIPKFAPTYKYAIGTSQYNLQRKPAYTDRVLNKLKSGAAKWLSYTADTSFTISDHKPVTAVISID